MTVKDKRTRMPNDSGCVRKPPVPLGAAHPTPHVRSVPSVTRPARPQTSSLSLFSMQVACAQACRENGPDSRTASGTSDHSHLT